MSPTVLVVGPTPPSVGGVVTFQKNLTESSLRQKWRMIRFSTSRPPKRVVSDNYSYGAIFNSGLRRTASGIGITAWHLLSFPVVLRREEVALVQIQSSDFYNFWEGMIYIRLAHAAGVAAVIRFGGDFRHFYTTAPPRTQRIIRRLLQTPEGIIVQSQGWKDYFSTLTDPERLHVIGNAVKRPPPPPDRSTRATVRAMFICTNDAKRKGVDAVLELAPRLRGKATLVFVAAGEEVQARVRAAGLDDVIELHGFTDKAGMVQHYDRSDLLLQPSFSEGFPNAMLEAMAAGLPVISSPVGAVPEVLVPELHGLLVAAGDAPALGDAILRLVEDPALRRKMGRACHALVCEEYELDVMFARFDRVWGGCLKT